MNFLKNLGRNPDDLQPIFEKIRSIRWIGQKVILKIQLASYFDGKDRKNTKSWFKCSESHFFHAYFGLIVKFLFGYRRMQPIDAKK